MKTRIVVVLLLVALAAAAGTVGAQRGRGGFAQGMGGPCGLGLGLGMGPDILGELGLTNGQVTQLQKITDQFVKDTQQLRTQMQTELKELAKLWTAEKPNESAIQKKIADVDRVRIRIRNTMIDRAFAAMKVLTQAQKTKLRDLVKNRSGFGLGMGYGLGLGCGMGSGGCYMMDGMGSLGSGGGLGYRKGKSN